MHDMVTVRATYKEAGKLLMLNLTPLGLIGVPRWMCGKDMTKWVNIWQSYLAIIFSTYITSPVVHHFTDWNIDALEYVTSILFWMFLVMHTAQVLEDIQMFFKMRVRLGGVIKSVEESK